MERIHSLLRKIQEVYYKKGEHQVIDIDLMLDYTRVLYADLLEARTEILAKGGMGFHLADHNANVIKAEEQASSEVATASLEDPVEVISNEDTLAEEESVSMPEVTVEEVPSLEEISAEAASDLQEETLEPVREEMEQAQFLNEDEQEVPLAVETQHETVVDEAVDTNEVVAEPEMTAAEASLMEAAAPAFSDASTDDLEDFSEIHFELPVVKDNASLTEKPADFHLVRKQKDIRSYIGINDKYQFMNELFANNKTAYEETLDKLSAFVSETEAVNWLKNEALASYSWSVDDVTFQSLMHTIKKYFAA